MFFQSIYQMMSAGTDLNINIRRTDGKLSVAVMPVRTTLKDETGQAIVPLILNGTPVELTDTSCRPSPHPCRGYRKCWSILKPSRNRHSRRHHKARPPSASSKETKETRETGKNGKTPQTCGRSLNGRKVLGSDDLLQAGQGYRGRGQAETDRGKNTGSAEGVSTMQPVPRRGYAGKAGFTTAACKQGNGRKTAGRADADIHGTTTRTADTARTADVSAGMPQPMYGGYYQNPVNGIPQQPMEYPQMYPGQPSRAAMAATTVVTGTVNAATTGTRHADGSGNYGKGIPVHSHSLRALTFDKDDESDRELLREDPLCEYIDFPHECRMKDEVQAELICY